MHFLPTDWGRNGNRVTAEQGKTKFYYFPYKQRRNYSIVAEGARCTATDSQWCALFMDTWLTTLTVQDFFFLLKHESSLGLFKNLNTANTSHLIPGVLVQINKNIHFLKPLVCMWVCSDELQWIFVSCMQQIKKKEAKKKNHKKKWLNGPIFFLLSLISVAL